MRKKLDIFDKLYFLIGLPWLFLMLYTSRMYTEIKVVMLVVLFSIAYFEIISKKIKLNRRCCYFVVVFVLYSILSLLYGILLGYEFDIGKDYALLQYYVVTPICIIVFGAVFSYKRNRVHFIWEALKYLMLALTVLDVIRVVLYMMGIDPPYLQFIMMASDGYQELLTLRVSNEMTLMFMVPVFVYLLMNPDTKSKKDRFIYLIIVVFGLIYSIMSGRKMLEISVFLSFIVSYIYANGRFSLKRIINRKTIKVVLICVLFVLLFSSVFKKLSELMGIENITELAYKTMVDGFSSGSEGVDKREGNTFALIDLWLESPLWGNGLNSYAEGSLANSQTKWSYEVVYVAWLAQTGLIGATLLIIPIVYILKRLKYKFLKYRDRKYFAFAIGFAFFIFCGASNPMVYLVWPWSICLMLCSEEDVFSIVNTKNNINYDESSYHSWRPRDTYSLRKQ